jgi:hypothetical protein
LIHNSAFLGDLIASRNAKKVFSWRSIARDAYGYSQGRMRG